MRPGLCVGVVVAMLGLSATLWSSQSLAMMILESCVNEQGHYSISRDSTVKRYMPMSENGHPVIAIVFVVESFSRFVFLCLR